MAQPQLELLVLRTEHMNNSLDFYRALGFELTMEQHGSGPVHYSCQLGKVVMEIYPGKPGVAPDRRTSGSTMVGFQVASLDESLKVLEAAGALVLTPAETNSWGRRAVVQDPDGRAIILNEAIQG